MSNGLLPPLVADKNGNFVTFLAPTISEPFDPPSHYTYVSLFQTWQNSVTGNMFFFNGMSIGWQKITTGGGSGILTLTGNSGGSIPPTAGNVNILGTGGVTVSGTGSTLTISASSSGITWTDKSSNFTASSNEAYFLNSALTLLMPPSPSQSDYIYVIVTASGTYNVRANTGQKLRVGTALSSLAGNAVNTAIGDSLEFYYREADSTWYCNSTSSTWMLT